MESASGGTWPAMLWIGGAQGAGKSTLAWALSRAHDLPLHPVDLWTYDHVARMQAIEPLDDQLARGAEAAADSFEDIGRRRLELVLADVLDRGLGDVPAVVEGPQLTPALALTGPLPRERGVWLLPDPERTRLTRQQRLASEEALAAKPAAGRSRLAGLLQRDALLAARIRETAAQAGRPVIEVPTVPDWAAIAVAVDSALEPALRDAPRLAPGPDLSRQRRRENAAAVRQGLLWMQDAGLASRPSYPFACECGASGCDATWEATPADYAARTAAQQPLVAHAVRSG